MLLLVLQVLVLLVGSLVPTLLLLMVLIVLMRLVPLVPVVLTGVNVHVELGADGPEDEAAGWTEHQRGEEDSCKQSHFLCKESNQLSRSFSQSLHNTWSSS